MNKDIKISLECLIKAYFLNSSNPDTVPDNIEFAMIVLDSDDSFPRVGFSNGKYRIETSHALQMVPKNMINWVDMLNEINLPDTISSPDEVLIPYRNTYI